MPTQHDHSQPIVFEIPEAVSSALDELHFSDRLFLIRPNDGCNVWRALNAGSWTNRLKNDLCFIGAQ
jgi:hypothetical protein